MSDIKQLSAIIKNPDRVVYSNNIEQKYLSDTLGRKKGSASALVFPVSTEEVSAVLKFAHQNNIAVTPRGAGTNLVGSTVPHDNAIIIDFSQMNHVLEIDKENFTALVEPGVILEDFQKQVEGLGLFYPPDPGEKRASIGGNISTNAGGMRAVKYGVTRDYVMGLELVLADGTVIWTGSKNRKDTTGLDIKDIVIGSEGTLAVITKCLLKFIGKPEKAVSILISFESLKAGIEAVSEQEPLDIVVPIKRVDSFVNYVNKLEAESKMQMISFGHVGDGNVHLCVVRGERSEESWEKELNENLKQLYAQAHKLGGLISGEHGLGVSKREFFFKEMPEANVQLMNQIKKAFDTKGILNKDISYVK